jgi:hypothetical protein
VVNVERILGREVRLNEPARSGGTLRVILFGRATAMWKISCSTTTPPQRGTRDRFGTQRAIALPNRGLRSNGCIERAPVGVTALLRAYSTDALPIQH